MEPKKRKKFNLPTDKQRLEDYFWKLESLIPNPPRDWARSAKPCKWAKILKEKEQSNATEEAR